MHLLQAISLVCLGSLVLAACGDSSKLPEQASIGSNPTIPGPARIAHSDSQDCACQGLAGQWKTEGGG